MAATVVSAVFGPDDPPSPGVVVTWVRKAGGGGPAKPTATKPPTTGDARTPEPGETPVATVSADSITGFAYPIVGACLPESDNLLPGVPREYRNGIHEGIDFYDGASCAAVGLGTEVLSAKAGTVVRADWSYKDLTLDDVEYLMNAAERSGGKDENALDAFRGRQVWIDHGDGVVSRYAHLDGIAEGITEGMTVGQGQLIGYVGESGTPESVTDPGTEVHLHFEIRVGDGYLGSGLELGTVRELYEMAFAPGAVDGAR